MPGQQYDKEIGLHYNRHRYYNPRQGRYITQDPIGLSGGWNTYVYPLNPVQFIDPLGLNACDLAPEPTALCGNPLFTGGMGSNTILDGLGPRGGLNGSGSMAGAGAIGGGAIGITSNTDVYDKSGLKVSPNAINMQPPGNCGPGEQKKMQEEVNGWCKGKQTPTSCRGISSPAIRSAIAEVNRQCAIARDNINKQCFSGGDMTHRNQAIDAWNKYSECQ